MKKIFLLLPIFTVSFASAQLTSPSNPVTCTTYASQISRCKVGEAMDSSILCASETSSYFDAGGAGDRTARCEGRVKAIISLIVADQEMTKSYTTLIATLKNKGYKIFPNKLKESQRQWIKSRDADCKFSGDIFDYEGMGTHNRIGADVTLTCHTNKILERNSYLKDILSLVYNIK